MTSVSEEILFEITKIMTAQELTMLEACAQFCLEHDIEEDTFVKMLDKTAIDQLKYAAIKDRQVRKKTAILPNGLDFADDIV